MATNGSSAESVERTNGHRIDSSVQEIVNQFLCSQLDLKGHHWTPEPLENGLTNDSHQQTLSASQRIKIVEALKILGHKYVNLYEQQLSTMCRRLELSPLSAMTTFNSVSNELFIEGIKWNHIITFLVFSAEFAYNCVENGFPYLVTEVSQWMSTYINQFLSQWIAQHGGWEYVIELADDRPEGGGKRKLVYGAAGALGVLTLGLFLRNCTFFK
ncbi:bcl-2-like protein 1 [Oppia nitens]|uniref:bcl-2-like protein 1 n=1 Tax=Oppia nitens TaxID=1686743 RepID=UPI0023DBCE2F|nr:bcl-2-like protein 1 [Oppia nitens]